MVQQTNNMPREIHIQPVLNGFFVNVGCQRIVIKTVAELGAEIIKYYLDPERTELFYIQNKVNNTMEDRPGASPVECKQAEEPMQRNICEASLLRSPLRR